MQDPLLSKLALLAAIILLAGVLLSGPLTLLIVSQAHPQPVEWHGIEEYARAFHPSQLLTFGFGFLTVLGSLGLFTTLLLISRESERIWALLALIFTILFAAVISVNYILQLAVLKPNILAGRLAGMELIAFNNPDSIAMALEMLGYGFLGVATWLAIPIFSNGRLGWWVRMLGVGNGLVSVLGTVLQATIGLRGVVGFACYLGWNVIFLALSVLYVVYFRRTSRMI